MASLPNQDQNPESPEEVVIEETVQEIEYIYRKRLRGSKGLWNGLRTFPDKKKKPVVRRRPASLPISLKKRKVLLTKKKK